ncbi:Kielin/chordin-like protein [Larimichthys crocea]|uniref:Uncharacterized protein n=1 Tax=Larimichthys crocea TaxID=215358 RepID=A0ACD3QDI4_LARCR|nr:Kielin/chordin-like protein [Larimichthys crocea]
MTQRKEIRDLTMRERRLIHQAIKKLYARPAVWKDFALLRAEFSPLAGDHAFFLPWHRYLLRLVERELQSMSSCKLALPYFEWTVDSGSMKSSAAWQAGLFGGDGEPTSGCVPHHPFQGLTSRFHWSPCLRRSFNSSVWLPDAVTLQKTLNQADFQMFSQSLQTFSGLFRLWVGGHMASPLASYDPLYLSHMAFMDKLWTQWQEKHQHGSKRQTLRNDRAQSSAPYLDRLRHVKMKPFDVTPDDVISSKHQMCVVYVPITIGAPCNITSSQKQPQGGQKYQKRNSHSSFVIGGFDQHGYDRDGYDRSGWDKYGYGKDGFNRDFFDWDGYDVSGFNRYGFNRSNVTWFGMREDGGFENEKRNELEKEKSDNKRHRVKTMSKLFSDKGYSIYGFNPFGLDRGGFDAFGFRTDGYDKDRCNWFFNGPHYLRFYFHTQQQLMSSSNQALKRITRTCPPVTSLPHHWAIQDWMTIDLDKSRASDGQLEQEWMGQIKTESDDTLMEATQNRSNTWLPITPDHRFCFELHWFSGCPLGSAPITCPDLCPQARCHGYPKAVCHTHNCGSCFTEWRDPATGNHVICHDWGVTENATPYPALHWTAHKRRLYLETAASNAEEGHVHCEREQCNTPCKNPTAPPPNTCCPVCHGCGVNGHDFSNGAVIPTGDRCQECICVNGNVACSSLPCRALSCRNPVHRAGDCCPRCEQCEYESKVYVDGQKFPSKRDPCLYCRCNAGEVSCERMDSSCQTLHCSHPAKRKGECCPTCNECEYDRRVYADGKAFIPAGSGPCLQCRCKGGNVICHEEKCPPVQCSNPIIDPHVCCPICKACVFEGLEYEDGSNWQPEGPCSSCTCVKGEILCTHTRCPSTECLHPTKITGSCCAVCESCTYNHRIYSNGQRFTTPDQPCHICTCQRGEVVCTQRRCPAVSCPHPALDGCACGVCDGCNFNGRGCFNGERFPHPADHCQLCSCLNGGVVCTHVSCPSVACVRPVTPPGECCPVCTGICLHQGKEYQSGFSFASPSDPCSSCSCLNEVVNCQRRPCPIQCSHPVPSDSCCPACDFCLYEGVVHSHSHTFTPFSSPCQRCTCVRGTVTCVPLVCPATPCIRPVTKPGHCCPECTVCTLDGQEFSDGQTWTLSSNHCSTCTCQAGEVQCASPECSKLPCMHQVTDPGTCCPRCRGCVYGGEEHTEGSSWFADSTPCMTCMCVDGVTTCSEVRCLSPCINFISVPGECCPVCAEPLSNCTAAVTGNEVLATDDPCFTCQCQDLTWTCLHQICHPLTCPFNEQFTPPDSCCPVCKDCVIEGQNRRVANGSSWTDSDDDCVTCTCNLGYIECSIEECLPAICLDGQKQVKIPGKCCYECQDSGVSCLYQGTVYHSNEQWEVDECTSCTCVFGDVHCQSERCPPLTCATDEMPAIVPGLCCPHCLPRPATCIAFGDPHYRTFDGRMLHFQGACTYILAQDCEGGDFSIHATNDDRGRKGVSWTKEVTVFIGDVTVQLLQDWVVKVNDEVVTLPFLKEPYIYVERQTNTILLNTNIGLKVLWSGRSHLEVSVPGSYKSHTCGLCGNFNNYYQDDLRMPNGRISQSESDFGNSWRVINGSHSLTSCRPGENVDPCKEAGYQAKKGANCSL